MVKKALIGVGVILSFVILYVSTRSAHMHIERNISINAPPEVVFTFLNDFHQWAKWNPWEKLDPNMKKTYSPQSIGVGAWYTWAGNDEAGEGKMTIIESKPVELVNYRLDFTKPFSATNATGLKLQPQGNATLVTWTLDGHNDFMLKAVGIFMDMDKQVGGDFERGLANLKTLAEVKGAAALPASQPK